MNVTTHNYRANVTNVFGYIQGVVEPGKYWFEYLKIVKVIRQTVHFLSDLSCVFLSEK